MAAKVSCFTAVIARSRLRGSQAVFVTVLSEVQVPGMLEAVRAVVGGSCLQSP